jgi:DNA-binding transcriptional LysR family regulator
MQLDVIKLFCDAAQAGSISRGAARHGITQSAASQRIMALERELGVQLIDRTTRPLTLTASGRVYYEGCEQILSRYERLKQQIASAADQQQPVQGTVRVAAIYSAGIDLLNRVAEDFERQHPQVRVRVEYRQPEGVHQQVRSHAVDLGILSYPERWGDLQARPLRNEAMAVVCRPDHALAAHDTLRPSDLADQPLVGFEPSLPIADRIAQYLRQHGVNAQLSHTFDNIDTIKAYLGHSDEAAILPDRTVRREVEAGQLAAIQLRPLLRRPVTIVTDPAMALSTTAKAFIEALAATSPNDHVNEAEPATTV